jgi:flavin-dependent dehydrogenase
MPNANDTLIGRAREYDAVVVGARAAGAATAMLLARAGRRVLLVDRSQYGADTLSTHALMRAGVMQLDRWGVLDTLRDRGTPAIRATSFHYGDDVVDVAIGCQYGIDALYAPRRTVLDPLLVDAARDAGAEVVFGVLVDGLRRRGDGRVAGITARAASGERVVADAAMVIGADGTGSSVARLAGAADVYSRHEASAYVYGYFPGLAADRYQWYFRPGLMGGAIPTNGGVANVSIGVPPDRFVREFRGGAIDGAFRTVLREVAPAIASALDGVEPVGRLRSYPGRPGHLRRSAGPGWALVGDAGYYKDPITAHGITDALRDAELLARSLLSTGDATRYEAQRDALARPFLDITSDIASYTWDMPELVALHRALKPVTDAEVELLAGLDTAAAA